MTKKDALIMAATAAQDFLRGFGTEFGRSNDPVLKSRAGEAARQAAGITAVIKYLAKIDEPNAAFVNNAFRGFP